MKRLAFVLAAAALSGCAANSYCLEEHDYQRAQSVPPLKGAEGLALPESPSALRVPPAPPTQEPFGKKVKDADGDERIVCLDKPPAMPPLPPVPEKAPEAPKSDAPASAPEAPKPAP